MSLPPGIETPATLVSSANTLSPSSVTVHYVLPSPDLAMEGVQAAVSLSPPPNKHLVLAAIMDEIITLPVSTIGHVPRRVRPLLAEVLLGECRHARLDGLWGFVRLSLLAKATLRAPPHGGKERRNDNHMWWEHSSQLDCIGGRTGTSLLFG